MTCECLNKATDDVELVEVVGHHPDCEHFQAELLPALKRCLDYSKKVQLQNMELRTRISRIMKAVEEADE